MQVGFERAQGSRVVLRPDGAAGRVGPLGPDGRPVKGAVERPRVAGDVVARRMWRRDQRRGAASDVARRLPVDPPPEPREEPPIDPPGGVQVVSPST
jgi:hypothetical protein